MYHPSPPMAVNEFSRARSRNTGRSAACGRVAPTLFVALSLLLATGCRGNQSLAGEETSIQRFGAIEQVLKLGRNPAELGGERSVHITSQLVNRGEAPVTLQVRTCYLRPGIDIVFTPAAEFSAIAQPACIREPDVITLQPGDSSSIVFFDATIQDSGRYNLAVRHSIDPEHWGKLDIDVR